jgi:Holliday junction resolvase RusA-like endonuclease
MIRVKLNITPPTATAQQKGATIRHGFIHFYKKDKVKEAEDFLELLLAPYAPETPLAGAVFVQVRWCFPYRKSEPKRVVRAGREIPHTSRPDLDNLEKNLLDVLTRLHFWTDDSRVFSKSTAKFWGPEPYLAIALKTEDELYNLEK